MQAFQRHPEWEVTDVSEYDAESSQEVATSSFHWGEYEGIDWEKVQAGMSSPVHPADNGPSVVDAKA